MPAGDESEASARLFTWIARAFAARGGEVILRDDDANWVRRRPDDGGAAFEIAVAGLPNLLHELTHAALFGGLADDHGIDYGQIPLRLGDTAHRQILWEELAASVVSCAYLGAEPAATDAWFAEQVEIQGVFYGVDDDLPALRGLLRDALARFPGEAEAVLARAYAACEAWLAAAGAPARVAAPPHRLGLAELWRRYDRGAGSPALLE